MFIHSIPRLHVHAAPILNITGVELVVSWMTLKALVNKRKAWSKIDRFYAAFSTALLVLITIYMSTEAEFGQEMWIIHSKDPGGPAAFFTNNVNIWYQTMGTTASVILIMLSDGLLVRARSRHYCFEILTIGIVIRYTGCTLYGPIFASSPSHASSMLQLSVSQPFSCTISCI